MPEIIGSFAKNGKRRQRARFDLKFTPDLNLHGDWPIKNTSTSL
jgi:hypothetical protein